MCPRLSRVGKDILSLESKSDGGFLKRNKGGSAEENSHWYLEVSPLHLSCYCHLGWKDSNTKALGWWETVWGKGRNERKYVLPDGKGVAEYPKMSFTCALKFSPWGGEKIRVPNIWCQYNTLIHWEVPLKGRRQNIQQQPCFTTNWLSLPMSSVPSLGSPFSHLKWAIIGF